ncbi:MAG: outer membrane protein assembly factor BamA, partial [Candidatus Eiseniibacteriota bacterium]
VVPAAPAAPDTAAPAVRLVGRVSVVGNTATDSTRILRTFEMPPGMRYTRDAVARGIGKLYALGLFENIEVDRVDRVGRGGVDLVDLVIRVVERRRITRIEFAGNKKKDTDELQKKLIVRVGEAHSQVAVQAQIDSLLRFYREDGYSQAAIEAVTDTTGGGLTVRFVVREGEKVKITRIEFVGNTAFAEKPLRKALKTKKKRFIFGGGGVSDENLAEDRVRLEGYYHDNGYRDARVLGHELKPGDTPRRLTLGFTIEQGPRYRVGEVAWSGNTVLSAATVGRYWEKRPGEVYDRSRIEKVQGQAYADYAEQGYLYVNIEPQETVRDSLVDVTFQVTEGQPSQVRLVSIRGNKATREKVIRREVSVREGDRFKRSALVRSQGDLMRLGFFEEVVPDFSPAESTDVDIIFKVKEKTVGTASAGAGYTGESGLTGFIELGHNNVLGNGQSLRLHLERGSRRSDYSISFTEPWFRDTPTLLGFSAFSFQRERDLFREDRRGGSVRVGRPLPWPDYSRGSLSYSLEDVKIDSLGTLSASDRLGLSGLEFGRKVRTSTVSTSFLRNSADHPLYPTHGARLSITSEFAGGAFGGGTHFHKHRLEQRVYVRSLLKAVTTMLRGRVGLIARYRGQTSAVPTYERFRLGGGTTPDPLRGYDDYMVVPEKFIRDVTTVTGVIDHIDSTTTPGVRDTVYRSETRRVRYPGGRFMLVLSAEQQFPIVHPLHGVVFFDAGNVWDEWREIRPFDLRKSVGIGFRMEIPLLGVIGFDYGYGFDRDDRPRAVGHFLIGQTSF